MNKEQLITLLLGELTTDEVTSPTPKKSGNRLLLFTEKEIMKMPKTFRKTFRAKGCTAHVRKRTDGRYNCSYEIRYAKKPYDNPPITASGITIEEAKARFIEKLNNYTPQDENAPTIPKDFHGFSIYWFENFHKAIVVPKTFSNNFSLYNRHIKEKLFGYTVSSITPIMLKNLIDNLPGNGKTADDVHGILNQIFKTAVTHGLIKINPLNLFVHIQHETQTGTELTREEEIKLLNAYRGTEYEIIFALMLYTGLRPNEYKTAKIDGKFIAAINSKRKNGKIEVKKIPIISHLKKYIQNTTEFKYKMEKTLRRRFNQILPNHMLKDLRKTFNTRCKECKVHFDAKEMFMGHSLGKQEKTYTGNLDNFLLAEAEKLEQWYSLYPKNTPNLEE